MCYLRDNCDYYSNSAQSSEEESESEEEQPKVQFRPVFVPKYALSVHIISFDC